MAAQLIYHLGRVEVVVLQQQLRVLGRCIHSLPLPWVVTPFTFPYAIAHDWVLGRRVVRYEYHEFLLRDPFTLSKIHFRCAIHFRCEIPKMAGATMTGATIAGDPPLSRKWLEPQ